MVMPSETPLSSDAAYGESGVCEGMTINSFSCALKCKLQPVECLTFIGTEGIEGTADIGAVATGMCATEHINETGSVIC